MTQYIKTPISRRAEHVHGDVDYVWGDGVTSYTTFFEDIDQRSQITFTPDNGTCISVDWHIPSQRVCIQNGSEHYFLSSPDITSLTVRNVLDALECANKQIHLEWCETEDSLDAILDMPVETAALHQLTITKP